MKNISIIMGLLLLTSCATMKDMWSYCVDDVEKEIAKDLPQSQPVKTQPLPVFQSTKLIPPASTK